MVIQAFILSGAMVIKGPPQIGQLCMHIQCITQICLFDLPIFQLLSHIYHYHSLCEHMNCTHGGLSGTHTLPRSHLHEQKYMVEWSYFNLSEYKEKQCSNPFQFHSVVTGWHFQRRVDHHFYIIFLQLRKADIPPPFLF